MFNERFSIRFLLLALLCTLFDNPKAELDPQPQQFSSNSLPEAEQICNAALNPKVSCFSSNTNINRFKIHKGKVYSRRFRQIVL